MGSEDFAGDASSQHLAPRDANDTSLAMAPAEAAAHAHLQTTVDLCTDSGLAEAWKLLTQDVYAGNLDRFEPDELGDTAMSFGVQCAENLKTRAIRRFECDDLEPAEHHWDLPGVVATTRRNSLMFEIAGNRIFVMKVPYGQGRDPQWTVEKHWEQGSEIRHNLAAGNSRVLGGYKTFSGGDDGLFPHPARPRRVRDYLLVWGGEAASPLTAGWLAVPTMGDKPFVAVAPLWWDDEPAAPPTTRKHSERGPGFEDRAAMAPEITIKPRPAAEGGQA
jgi:hypothetical protein